jgi:hypothetical protein
MDIKILKKMATCAYKSDMKPQIQCLAFFEDKVIVTDTFVIVEYKTDTGIKKSECKGVYPVLVPASFIKSSKSILLDSDGSRVVNESLAVLPTLQIEYPDITALRMFREGEPCDSAPVNKFLPENIIKVLGVFGDTHTNIRFMNENGAMYLTGKDLRALIMPLNK